jgi:2-methylcitrate dehydratase
MDVKDLQGRGLFIPYDKLKPHTVNEVKYRIIDTILALIGGALWVPKDEIESLYSLIDENPNIRPIWPLGLKTSLEMAGFLNAYFIRYVDWGDTYRRHRGGVGGHPSDQIATILALCDTPGMSGRKIIELTHLAYQLYSVIQEQMLWSRPDLDYTTTLSLTTPVIAATCFNETPQRVQNALNLSASSGTLLEQIRRDVTNLKSAASAYAVARGLWCYRFSKAIQAPDSMFEGEYGWYKVVAPLEGELKSLGSEFTYDPIQVKSFPCCNAAQSAVECALNLHRKISEKIKQIQCITIYASEVEAKIVNKPEQAKYPECHADADHHIRYCTATALQFGSLTPLHYSDKYLQDKLTRHLIDIMEVKVLTKEEAAALDNQEGACILEISLKDGDTLMESISRASGVLHGLKAAEREQRFKRVIERKREMIEKASGLNLSPISETVMELEDYDGCSLLDRIQSSLNNK